MQTKGILFTGINQVELGDIELPAVGPGQALVETVYSGISPGTELRCLAGKQPDAAPWPFVPGYSLAGRVQAIGAGVELKIGDPVFCTGSLVTSPTAMWGGHVGHAVRDGRDLLPVPKGVGLEVGAIAHMAGIAYHGLRLARPMPHEVVAVVGLGAIGQLSARLFAATGARVVAGDVSPTRVAVAQRSGIEAFGVEGDLVKGFKQRIPEGADIIVDATGAVGVLPQAIELARELPWADGPQHASRYVVQGSYPADFVVPYRAAFRKQLTFLLSRDMQYQDVRAVFGLLERGRLRLDDLVESVCSPADAAATYAELRDANGTLLLPVFAWR
ncbi:MAG: zinc-binding alcohol dehydrogenase [Anaerolineales bacterium]|nr:zinc-binding alcohol dehydrogenase [Anaerolineales bacterium]